MTGAEHARPNFVAVWAWLVGLLALSVLSAYLPFSQAVTITLIFVIAVAKALMVAAYFMNMRFDRGLIYAIAITPVVLFVIMTVTLIPDIVYRH